MIMQRICDYCYEKLDVLNPRHCIPLSNRPNDEDIWAEICDKCLSDIEAYIKLSDEAKIIAELREKAQSIEFDSKKTKIDKKATLKLARKIRRL